MNPAEIIQSFVNEKLGGDIWRLADYPLGLLRNDKIYGCPYRRFDSDDSELMRAVYCIVFAKAWKHLSMSNSGEGKLRGDTLNTYNTLFSAPWNDKFTVKWNPDDTLKAKILQFQTTCYTMGNMAVLPDRRIGDWSINKHRGCHDEWHDYEDRFLAALYKVLTRQDDRDADLDDLVKLNDEDFLPFYGIEGWRKFIDLNLLNYYVDSNYKPVVLSKGYTFWRGGYTNKERFFTECHRYIDFSTELINDRAKKMIEIVRNGL